MGTRQERLWLFLLFLITQSCFILIQALCNARVGLALGTV